MKKSVKKSIATATTHAIVVIPVTEAIRVMGTIQAMVAGTIQLMLEKARLIMAAVMVIVCDLIRMAVGMDMAIIIIIIIAMRVGLIAGIGMTNGSHASVSCSERLKMI